MKLDIRKLDIYRKVPQDLTEPTFTGAVISLLCVFGILLLLITEFLHFLSPEIVNEMIVDTFMAHDRIPVTLNISLPRLHCNVTGLDIQDNSGRHEVGFVKNTVKIPINGGVGCRMETHFDIARVPGNFHVSTHSAHHQPENVQMSHEIHDLKMGDDITDEEYYRIYHHSDKSQNRGALHGTIHMDKPNAQHSDAHEYHLKIVPSVLEEGCLSTERKTFYQYTYAHKASSMLTPFGVGIPAIWFRYDMNPITIKYKTRDRHWYSFITLMFSLIGGTFTVAGIVNSIIFTTSNLFKKIELNKLN